MKIKLLSAVLLLSCLSSAATTVLLSGTGRFKAFDPDTGALLTGGQVCSYVSGTTTPTSTYTDSTGAVPNSTCITLDASGEAAIWLDPSIVYRLVLKDSGAANIWTLDGVNTPAAGVFTTLSVASSLSVPQITLTQATGTAPMVVSSTTRVANLNADKLDDGDWANPPVGLGSTTRTPGTSQLTTLNVSGASTLTGTTSLGTVTQSGLTVAYNGVACVSNCFPQEVATVDLTALTAAIGTTTLYAVPTSGQYRVSWDAKVTTAAGTSSTLGALTITYTDPDGVVIAPTMPGWNGGSFATTNAANTTGTVLLGSALMLNCKAGTNITYAMGYASNAANAMNYNLHIKVEAQ